MRVQCPTCSVILEVPEEYPGTLVRCSACQTGFQLPNPSAQDDILSWLGTANKDETRSGEPAPEITPIPELMGEMGGSETEMVEALGMSAENLSTNVEGVTLLRMGRKGPVFEFPQDFLSTPSFRGAFARKCLRCGARRHIQPHPVIFTHQLLDPATIEQDYVTSDVSLTNKEIRTLETQEILQRLPELPKLKAPLNLPMPYYACDMCAQDGLVFAQGHIRNDAGQEVCHVQISRVWRAEEFLINLGGEGSPAHSLLQQYIHKHPETPWDNLAGTVQQRMKQWYKPLRGERFVCYTPDRTKSRTEDGMAGVVVTNRRLIHHCSMRHRESNKGEKVELDFAMEAGQMRLHIASPSWDLRNIIVDKPGLERLRRALTKEKFNAVWY